MSNFQYAVFVKPWREKSLKEIAVLLQDMGFNAMELPVRDGFPVNPENALTALPDAEKLFADHGVKITSLATDPNEDIIKAAGSIDSKPLLRDMAKIEVGENYLVAQKKYQDRYRIFAPVLESEGIRIGVQHHNNRYVANASGLKLLLDPLDPKLFGAIWDPSHCALAGELPDLAMDILEDRIFMVNLKNALWRRVTGPEAEEVRWKHYWTAGNQGLSSWSDVAAELKKRNWSGTLTLCAEYSDESSVERLTRQDIVYAKKLFG